jgi:hypothetical protein
VSGGKDGEVVMVDRLERIGRDVKLGWEEYENSHDWNEKSDISMPDLG